MPATSCVPIHFLYGTTKQEKGYIWFSKQLFISDPKKDTKQNNREKRARAHCTNESKI
jgi:hypothetical protein